MEEPNNISSSNKIALSYRQHLSSSEESGWTTYLDDFCACSSILRGDDGGGGSSVVSDASSCAAWKAQTTLDPLQRSSGSLGLKKKKGRKVLEDSTLEDTASSPVNNRPKAGEKSFLNVKARKGGNSKVKFAEKELGREANESDNVVRVKDECSDLRAKGLCLVPLSMLSNYLG